MTESNKPSLSSDFINVDNLTLEQGSYTEDTALLLHCLDGVGDVLESGRTQFKDVWNSANGLFSKHETLSDAEKSHLDKMLKTLYTWNDRMDACPG